MTVNCVSRARSRIREFIRGWFFTPKLGRVLRGDPCRASHDKSGRPIFFAYVLGLPRAQNASFVRKVTLLYNHENYLQNMVRFG